MAKARQNLEKRMNAVALRSRYNVLRSSYGPEWERLAERRGLGPFRTLQHGELAYKLAVNSVYGKFAFRPE